MELAFEDLLDGEGFVDLGVFGFELDGRVWGVGEEGGVVVAVRGWVGEVVVGMEVGLVLGVAEISVEEISQEDLLDIGRDDRGDEQEAWGVRNMMGYQCYRGNGPGSRE